MKKKSLIMVLMISDAAYGADMMTWLAAELGPPLGCQARGTSAAKACGEGGHSRPTSRVGSVERNRSIRHCPDQLR